MLPNTPNDAPGIEEVVFDVVPVVLASELFVFIGSENRSGGNSAGPFFTSGARGTLFGAAAAVVVVVAAVVAFVFVL